MKELFTIPMWQFDLTLNKEWPQKKKLLQNLNKKHPYKKSSYFDTNRDDTGHEFISALSKILEKPLEELSQELKMDLVITKGWSARFKKGDFIIIHKHASVGLSGTIYLNYDESIGHSRTVFKQPFPSYWNDYTFCKNPIVKEGALIVVPSHLEHFTLPNTSKVPKEIISFDMLVGKPV